MPGVFISYRREDSAAYAGRLFDILSTEFGSENTFMDGDDIKGGDNFELPQPEFGQSVSTNFSGNQIAGGKTDR